MAKGAKLHHPLKYLQMHSRSSLKGLMDSEMSKMGNLTGWLLSKSRWTYFQQSLIVLPPSNSPLAIPVKMGRFLEGSSWGGVPFWGGASQKLILSISTLCLYVIYGFWVYVLNIFYYGFAKYFVKQFGYILGLNSWMVLVLVV